MQSFGRILYVFLMTVLFAVSPLMFTAASHAVPRTDDDKINESCGPDNATKTILIAYDTIHGSTAEVAAQIGQDLCDVGYLVDVRWVGDVTGVDGYDGFIVASAIYKFSWMPDAKAFIEQYAAELNAKKTALFIVGASMSQDTPETREAVQKAFVDPILDEYFETAPVSIGLFGGAFDLTKEKYTLFERIVLRILGIILRLPDKKKADWRNWDTIHAWAAEVGEKMQ